jgi:hypothetical protein
MPGSSTATGSFATHAGLVQRPRFIKSREIESPPKFGEKPYKQLVEESFDGPVLRLSQKLRLLEEADNRHIRRGDAIDLITATRHRLEKKFSIPRPTKTSIFIKHFACFATAYLVFALACCAVVALH